ncbi:hypothetical protein Halhy_0263 [Haliscomenobacter hydrossis DSM 1100]|uniref:Uncharacterized protein n=1 Tax=Haliscomenobacter hydrossis (strain ATCC 27775 / DSM 1100 / LMG 10767 / O) TaxID=760192 RepID=F4KUZ9_HALH1|nr:hypothetical protein Halhy_0263 [Haliscomenobacter hydrossis DSM 1100]
MKLRIINIFLLGCIFYSCSTKQSNETNQKNVSTKTGIVKISYTLDSINRDLKEYSNDVFFLSFYRGMCKRQGVRL